MLDKNTSRSLKRKPLICLFCIIIVVLVCSCEKKENDSFAVLRDDGARFESTKYSLDYSDGENSVIFLDEYSDKIITVVDRITTDKDNLSTPSTEVVVLDPSDSSTVKYQIHTNNSSFEVYENRLIYINDNTLMSLDLDTGNVCTFLNGADNSYYAKLQVIDDELVVTSVVNNGEFVKYEKIAEDGSVSSTVTFDDPDVFLLLPLVEVGNRYYATVMRTYFLEYYDFSWESGVGNKVAGLENKIFNPIDTSNEYYFNDAGVYKFDPSNSEIYEVCSYSDSNIIPPSNLICGKNISVINENEIYICYSYVNGNVDIVKCFHTNEADNRETIRIEGYNISSDNMIQMAVYNYNNSQDQYKAVIKDYNYYYPYENAVEASDARIKIITDWEENGYPDILYGAEFNYQYMGLNGQVIDMLSYMEESNIDITENISSVISKDSCYQMFYGYYLTGYIGLKSDFPSNEVTYKELETLSEQRGIKAFWQHYVYDVFDGAIRYGLNNILEEDIQIDEILVEDLLRYSFDQGYEVNFTPNAEDTIEHVSDKFALLSRTELKSLSQYNNLQNRAQEEITFVGFPSIETSYHMVTPVGNVAITSQSNKPDECWKLIEFLVSDDTQRMIADYGYIPVDQSVFDDNLQKEINENNVSADVVEGYIDMLNSIDTIQTMDWGLFKIILEETASYTIDKKDIPSIAHTLSSRINVYISENY